MLEFQKAAFKGLFKTVTTAGTRVQVSTVAGTWVRGLVIKAAAGNAGIVYVGDVTVSATVGGYPLAAGESITVAFASKVDAAIDLSKIYVDASGGNGQIVSLAYLEVVQ